MNKLPPKMLITLVAACFLGVVLALVGAEFPADTSFLEALPFWLTIVCTAAFLLTTFNVAIGHVIEGLRVSSFLKTCITGATTISLAALPVALMCLPIDSLLPDSDRMFKTSSALDGTSALSWMWADQYLNLLPAIAGFWLFIKALDLSFPSAPDMSIGHSETNNADQDRSETAVEQNVELQERKPSVLERRFPEISGLTLLAIEADEHYVRLHTQSGSQHVLYRFRDALKDVEELAGLRVHRSWWVAEDAIEELEQGASGLVLKLKCGIKAPVSQTYRRDVERSIAARSKSG